MHRRLEAYATDYVGQTSSLPFDQPDCGFIDVCGESKTKIIGGSPTPRRNMPLLDVCGKQCSSVPSVAETAKTPVRALENVQDGTSGLLVGLICCFWFAAVRLRAVSLF